MSRDHHDLFRLEIEIVGGGKIDFAIRLVVLDEFGSEDGVPGQAAELGKVGHQRDIAIRKRSDDVFFLQTGEPFDRVGPRFEPDDAPASYPAAPAALGRE